jgi:membrane-bound metal-dependent hydrolase YbcI (DUF457 family)
LFIGHFAIGFASKRFAPRTSLATLIAAPLFLDILFPVFVLTGLEHARIAPGTTRVMPVDLFDYPWSHSLLMSVVWSMVFGTMHFAFRRDRIVALVLGAGVFSHFILDWITHRPDMQLYPGSSTRVGLGLWNSVVGTLVIEGSLFIAGVVLYATGTRAQNRRGSIGFGLFVLALVAVYLGSLFGPPPSNMTEMTVSGVIGNLLFFWIAWFDRHREALYWR